MTYQINTYDAEKRHLRTHDAPDELELATNATRSICQELDDGSEAQLLALVGTGSKWLLGFRMIDGTATRLTPEILAKDAEIDDDDDVPL